MLSQVNSFSAAQSYSQFVSGAGGKLYVPVKPSQVIFSQFEHVSGVAAGADGGVPISKINILNTLIDQLIKIKTNVQKQDVPSDLTDKQVDALIKDYQNQITTALNAAKANPFALPPQTGLVVDAMV